VTGGRTGIAPAVARLTGAAGRADDASTDALIRPTATVRPKLMTMAVRAAQRATVGEWRRGTAVDTAPSLERPALVVGAAPVSDRPGPDPPGKRIGNVPPHRPRDKGTDRRLTPRAPT
jgi:hypothetical protein